MLNYKMPYICRKIKGEDKAKFSSFCDCVSKLGRTPFLKCSCGEEDGWVEWTWDPGDQGPISCSPHGTARFIGRGFGRPPGLGSPLLLMEDNRQVMFHPSYSTGTAAIRGEHALEPGMHHYWEVKILTSLYGTDIMVGVGTAAVELRKDSYCSLLGEDNESWGYSYNGNIQHGGHSRSYGHPFGLGSIIGVHVDLWHGRLEFYLNRKPLGVAFTNIHGKTLFPMVSSAAAKIGVRLIHASSHPHSLLFSCSRALGAAADASSSSPTESQPPKRLCLNHSVSAQNSSLGASVPCILNPNRYVINGPNHNPSRFKECNLPSPSSNSIRGAHFCSPSNRMDGTEKEAGIVTYDTVRCASVVGRCSNLESGESGTAEPVDEPSRTLFAVFKRDQGLWSNGALCPGRCKEETVSMDSKVGCAQSNETPESLCNRSENHLLNETNVTIKEPYFLPLPSGNDEDNTSKSEHRKRKQPSNDSIERIWAIPGLRAKVEGSLWWLLGTRRGKGVMDVSTEAASSSRPFIMIIVDDDDDWRCHHGVVSRGSNEGNAHHQSSEGSVSQTCHERLCLLCHPVI